MKKLVAVFLLACMPLMAEDKKPESKVLDKDVANKVLMAEHALDGTEGKMKDLAAQYANMQSQMKDLQTQFQKLQQDQAAQKSALDSAIDDAYKSAGKDKAKEDFNRDTLVFSPKAPANPAPPSPGKP